MSHAMVKPPPNKPRRKKPAMPPDPYADLKEILEMFGNDRAYSVLKVTIDGWLIHLAGDVAHTWVKWDGEKPVMTKEGE